MQLYNQEEITIALGQKELSGWQYEGTTGEIFRQFSFVDFGEALAFVNKIGAVAEEEAHHPDIIIKYNQVTLSVRTHDAGGITARDFLLATRVNMLVER